MFCPNCGTNLPDGTKFCSNCGSSVSQPAPAQNPQPAQNQQPAASPYAPNYQQPQQPAQQAYQQPAPQQPAQQAYQQPEQQNYYQQPAPQQPAQQAYQQPEQNYYQQPAPQQPAQQAYQQPEQQNYYQQPAPQQPKKPLNKKLIAIIASAAVVVIAVAVVLIFVLGGGSGSNYKNVALDFSEALYVMDIEDLSKYCVVNFDKLYSGYDQDDIDDLIKGEFPDDIEFSLGDSEKLDIEDAEELMEELRDEYGKKYIVSGEVEDAIELEVIAEYDGEEEVEPFKMFKIDGTWYVADEALIEEICYILDYVS